MTIEAKYQRATAALRALTSPHTGHLMHPEGQCTGECREVMAVLADAESEKPATESERCETLKRDAYAMAEALGIYNAFIAEAPESVQQHFAGILRVTQRGWEARDRVMVACADEALKEQP